MVTVNIRCSGRNRIWNKGCARELATLCRATVILNNLERLFYLDCANHFEEADVHDLAVHILKYSTSTIEERVGLYDVWYSPVGKTRYYDPLQPTVHAPGSGRQSELLLDIPGACPDTSPVFHSNRGTNSTSYRWSNCRVRRKQWPPFTSFSLGNAPCHDPFPLFYEIPATQALVDALITAYCCAGLCPPTFRTNRYILGKARTQCKIVALLVSWAYLGICVLRLISCFSNMLSSLSYNLGVPGNWSEELSIAIRPGC